MYVLDMPRIDYTLARGPLKRGAQLGAIGPTGLRPALLMVFIISLGQVRSGQVRVFNVHIQSKLL